MGNLALFLKTTRMNKVVKDNHGCLSFNGRCSETACPNMKKDPITSGSLLLSLISKKMKGDVYKFLSVDTVAQFKNIKNEIDGLKQEKEDAFLTMQEQKRKLIYDKEEITITRMLNIETGRQMADLEKNTYEATQKRLTLKG